MSKPEYKVVDLDGCYQWIKKWDGSFLVNSGSLDEFKKEYPDAIEVKEEVAASA